MAPLDSLIFVPFLYYGFVHDEMRFFIIPTAEIISEGGVMIFRYFRRVVLSLLAPLVLNTAGSPVNADTILVPSDHVTIQAAIDAASAGDEIVVAPATYFETIDLSGKAISLRSSLARSSPSSTDRRRAAR